MVTNAILILYTVTYEVSLQVYLWVSILIMLIRVRNTYPRCEQYHLMGGVLDWMKRGKGTEYPPNSFCFLNISAMGPASLRSCFELPTMMDANLELWLR